MTEVNPANKSVRPYAPAWFNQLNDWLDKLPGAVWMYWFTFGLILCIIETLIQWRDGTYPVGTFSAWHAVLCFSASYILGVGVFLNNVADHALVEFQPVMKADAEMNEQLHYRLTTQSWWLSLVTTFVPMLFGIFYIMAISLPEALRMNHLSTSTLSAAFNTGLYLLLFGTNGAATYFTIQRLQMVSHIYTTYTHVHLFELGPLYGLARLSAYSGIGYLLALYVIYVTAPPVFYNWLGIAAFWGLIAVMIFCFVWPVLGIHRLLLDEKARHLLKNAQRLETTLEELHSHLEAGEIGDMDKLNHAVTALQLERKALKEITTWPWSPDTLRGMIAAVILPLGLWVIQKALERSLPT